PCPLAAYPDRPATRARAQNPARRWTPPKAATTGPECSLATPSPPRCAPAVAAEPRLPSAVLPTLQDTGPSIGRHVAVARSSAQRARSGRKRVEANQGWRGECPYAAGQQ